MFMLKLLFPIAWKRIILGVLVSILGGISTFLVNVILIKLIIDGLYQQMSIPILCWWIIFILIFSLITSVLGNVFNLYKLKINTSISKLITGQLMKKLEGIDLKKYENSEFYDEYSRVLEKGDDIFIKSLNSVNSLISSLVIVGAIMTYIGRLSSLLILVCLVVTILSYCFNKKIVTNNYQMFQQISYDNRCLNYVDRLHYLREYAQEIRLFHLGGLLKGKYNEYFENKLEKQKKYYRLNCFFNLVYQLLPYLVTYLFITLHTAYKITKHLLEIGDFVSINNASFQLISRFNLIIDRLNELYENSLYITNYKNFLENDLELQDGSMSIPDLDTSLIEFEDVSFTYNQGQHVLHNINFKLNQGEKTAIVGLNGAGKSTFLKLMMRLYDPTSGRVKYNNQDVREYKVEDYYKIFGTVFQDFKQYAFSIKENMYFSNAEDMPDDHATTILQKVGLWNKIMKHAKGINSHIGNEFTDGLKFSGGELQKLAIARSMAKNSKIMVFDEASSALDPISEHEINELLFHSFQNQSMVIVSHRLSTVVSADKIYFFEHGEIVESGSHKELIELQGRYYKLFQLQASQYGM